MSLPTRRAYLTYVASQIGVKEKPMGSNRQPYGVAYGMNGVAWCQEFDWDCAQHMGVPHLKTASTMAAVDQARKNGTWHDGTKGINPGDSIYFHWASSTRAKNQPDHVETVEKVLDDGGIQTIGGNVQNMVHRQIRRSSILGYIRHDFAVPTTPSTHLPPDIRPGSSNKVLVTRMQEILIRKGFGKNITATGLFGPKTVLALMSFQRSVGLTPTGVCGPRTWAALLR
jgi:murein L,D-transpeptidase YcbB/YkuD